LSCFNSNLDGGAMPQKFSVGDKVKIKTGMLKGQIWSITGISRFWINNPRASRKLYYINDHHYFSYELQKVKKQ
jgi:hypothetical protein